MNRSGLGYSDEHGDYTWIEQPSLFAEPEQLRLVLSDPLSPDDRREVPLGMEPVDAPDAPAALPCVQAIVSEVAGRLEVSRPRVREFRPVPVPDGEDSYEHTLGVVFGRERAVWLNVRYRSPQGLADAVAHELVHVWQNVRRGRCLDDMEEADREEEAQRRASQLVPKGSVRTPRGKARDAWFEPARRRYG